MEPVVPISVMTAIDAAAAESVEVLIERAGAAVAREALRLLGGGYGRRVVLVAGTGNNGADGRVAARHLRRRGASVREFDAADAPAVLPRSDLVIDAAYGTGFRGEYSSPDPNGAIVLAVDIPSGLHGDTGEAGPTVRPADVTLTFAARKPGLLLGDGPRLAGRVVVADIGLPVASPIGRVVEADVHAWIPRRPRSAHKWRAALWIVAGSPGMTGAARLAALGAQRAGAGMVRLSCPGARSSVGPTECVELAVPATGWASEVLEGIDRVHALVIGPGLGRIEATMLSARNVIARAPVPAVVDGDALFALAWGDQGPVELLRHRAAPTVLTPHDGEMALLTGERPGPDRIGAAQRLAVRTGAVVLSKGPVTVVADDGGRVALVDQGDERLATAGTGDVLAGIIGALLAQGVPAFEAAAAGAWLHGAAAGRGAAVGFVAGDLPDLLPSVLDDVLGAG